MELTITQFRRKLFEMVDLVTKGVPLFITYRGNRFQIVLENPVADRFSRLTPLQVINPEIAGLDDAALKEEMVQAWEKDWAGL